jgi:hypothetical protein
MIQMTELKMPSTAALDVPSDVERTLKAAFRTPVLITEQRVLFSTAAAMPVRPATTRWWIQATHVIAAALRQTFFPDRYSYLDDALMAREMLRL